MCKEARFDPDVSLKLISESDPWEDNLCEKEQVKLDMERLEKDYFRR